MAAMIASLRSLLTAFLLGIVLTNTQMKAVNRSTVNQRCLVSSACLPYGSSKGVLSLSPIGSLFWPSFC